MTIATDGQAIGARLSVEATIGKLTEMMGSVNETVQRLHQFLTPNPRQSPIVRALRGTVVSDGSTYVFVNLVPAGPASGRVWDVRRLTVARTTLAAGGFADAFTQPASVIAGVAIMHSAVPNTGGGNLTAYDDLVAGAIAANTPLFLTYSAHEVTLRGGQFLVAVIKATTTGDQYLVTGQAEEYVESSGELVVA